MKISRGRMLIVKLCVLSFTLPSLCQNAQQLASRFKTVSAYELRTGILMLAKFDADGQICQATITPVAAESAKSAADIPQRLADELIEEIVPMDMRGAPERFFDPDSTVAGGVYEVKMNYALVTVEEIGFYSVDPQQETIQRIVLRWRKRECN
ncbi:MAG: hypothetical protein ACRD4E_12400 [Bryobacteraceae bacterium]